MDGAEDKQGSNEIKWAVENAWDVLTNVLRGEKHILEQKNGKWSIASRSKIKSLGVALYEYEDPDAGVTHFVKYAEYMLPRSDLSVLLENLLRKVSEARKQSNNDAKKLRDLVNYLVGYLCWSMDAVCNVLTEVKDEEKAKGHLRVMLEAENIEKNKIDTIVDAIIASAKRKETKRG